MDPKKLAEEIEYARGEAVLKYALGSGPITMAGRQEAALGAILPLLERAREEWVREALAGGKAYDENFGDEIECACGHVYYRHFDTYDDMSPVGCKYCECHAFRAPVPQEEKRDASEDDEIEDPCPATGAERRECGCFECVGPV